MSITYLKRINGATNSLVQLDTTDTTAVAIAPNYITLQAAIILAINEGGWTWEPNDMILLSASDGLSWCSIDATFDTLTVIASNVVPVTESVQNGIIAFAGGGQTNATQLTKALNRITVVASSDDSVKLPASIPGEVIEVINSGANPMQVFGLGTDTINGVASATGVSQLANTLAIYKSAATGLWESLGGSASNSTPGFNSLGIHSATFISTGATASIVVTDALIVSTDVVIARFISSANVVTTQTVLPANGSFTLVTDTAPGACVIEYISFVPSSALIAQGVVGGKGTYGGGSATFVIADANVTAGMVVNANFQSEVTPSRIYTATAGAGTITFVCSANPGVCVMNYMAVLPSAALTAAGLEAVNYSYAGGFASIVISDPLISATSVVTAEFKSQSVVALIQKVTPSAGTLTILASIDPGPSVVAYIATPNASSGGSSTNGSFNQVTASTSTSSATPGTIRDIYGKTTGTATTMTSGNLVGVRGEVDLVGASGGFIYGVQGKVIPTGTLSGSVWAPAVFGQYDLSAATLNAGQIAPIWADMGASGGTFTDVTGARMFAGTNTIASLTLNSMIYLYGKATSLLELSGSSATYITAGAATPSGTLKKLAITIDGVVYYILAATVWS